MTAVDIREISKEDLPQNCLNGTPRRRVRYHVRYAAAASGYTLDLSTYDTTITGIESTGIPAVDGANVTGTAVTWSGTTLTTLYVGTAYLTVVGYK